MGLRERQLVQNAGISLLSQYLTASITMETVEGGVYQLAGSGAVTVTLPDPVAGPASEGGDDGKMLIFVNTTAHAHVVTTGTGMINGVDATSTSAGAVGNATVLIASNGIYVVAASSGQTLS